MKIQELVDNILQNAFERWKKEHPDQANIAFDDWRRGIKDIEVIRGWRQPQERQDRKTIKAGDKCPGCGESERDGGLRGERILRSSGRS